MSDGGDIFKFIVESGEDVAFVADTDGRIEYVSPSISKCGHAPSELIGRPLSDLAVSEDRENVGRIIRQIVGAGEDGGLAFRTHDQSGGTRWFSGKCRPVYNGTGAIVGAAGVLRDNTEARKVEQDLRNANILLSDALTELKRSHQQVIQSERLSAIGQMVSGIAHNLNNALVPVVGFTEFLIKYPRKLDNRTEALAILEDIRAAAESATETIGRLKLFYKSSDGSDHAAVDLNAVMRSALMLTRPKWKDEAESKGISFKVEDHAGTIPRILGNESHLGEAVTSVILNAIDAMPSGGTLLVETSRSKDWVTLSVKDTGIGMSDEIMRRCFEPFFTTKGIYGTGMGLAVTHGIVRQHGGKIDVESKTGGGTSFHLRFPVRTAEVAKARDAISAPSCKRLRVLVVDDEKWSRIVVGKVLEEGEHDITAVACGAEGIEAFRNGKFDLVITDRAMPDMSGDRVAVEIKKIDPSVPVLMVTGFGAMMEEAGECPPGVDAILGKPVGVEELRVAVNNLVARRGK